MGCLDSYSRLDLDSDASAHMTNKTSALAFYEPYSGNDSVIVGNGNAWNISHIGTNNLSNHSHRLEPITS